MNDWKYCYKCWRNHPEGPCPPRSATPPEIKAADDALREATEDLRAKVSDLTAEVAVLVGALNAALPRIAHRFECGSTRPTEEWAEHGSVSFENCNCEIKTVKAALANTSEAAKAMLELIRLVKEDHDHGQFTGYCPICATLARLHAGRGAHG